MYETFHPRDGLPLSTHLTRFGAWLTCKLHSDRDWARVGQGWVR